MVITEQLREMLSRLGAKQRELEWLTKPEQRTKGAITIDIREDAHASAMAELEKVSLYKFTYIPGTEGRGKKDLHFGVTIEVDVPFVRGRYQLGNLVYDYRILAPVPNHELEVVIWRSAVSTEEGVLDYWDWVEAIMRGELKLLSTS
jgi:hypothetical protein